MRLLLRAVFAAALVLSLATAAASANRLSVDDQDFVIQYERLLYVGGASEEVRVICDITLAGSFTASTWVKEAGRIGEITSASVGNCSGGEWRFLTETLPWSIEYDSFIGTLPQIEGIEVLFLGYSFQIRAEFFTCLLQTEAAEPVGEIFALEEGGTVEEIVTSGAYAIDGSGDFYCDVIEMRFSGVGAVEDGEEGSLAIDLI